MYTIILNDGTKIENLELNGNNFIADGIIDEAVFADNLATVTIADGETTDTYTDMKLIANRVWDGKTWFVLAEKPKQEKKDEAINQALNEFRQALSELRQVLSVLSGWKAHTE